MRQQPGVVSAVVRDVNDPSGQGRVQLEFPWLPGDPRSAWAPVASPLAGSERGLWFMPELGDEVLVAFEQGDFDHPFIIGYLWNGVDTPPDTDVEHRVLVTPGGHELRFEDNDGARKVVLTTSGGHELVLSDIGGETRVEVTTSGGHSLTLNDTSQTITLQSSAGQAITVNDMAQSLELSGGGRRISMSAGQVRIQ